MLLLTRWCSFNGQLKGKIAPLSIIHTGFFSSTGLNIYNFLLILSVKIQRSVLRTYSRIPCTFLSHHINMTYIHSPCCVARYTVLLSCTTITGRSFSEALILTSTNPQCNKRLLIESPVQYINIPISEQSVVILWVS